VVSKTPIFLEPESQFREALRAATKVLVEVPLYRDDRKIWQFENAGYKDREC
jgi:hypothetical protein